MEKSPSGSEGNAAGDEQAVDKEQRAQIAVYQEICKSYHAIDTFRARLLGLLPLASGTGIFLLWNSGYLDQSVEPWSPKFFLPVAIGVFGFISTLGLFAYELRAIQRCNFFIKRGENLESNALGVEYGQFTHRPVPPLGGLIGNTLAARLIYPIVLAAWTFVALVGTGFVLIGGIAALCVFVLGFVVSGRFDLSGESEPESSREPQASLKT